MKELAASNSPSKFRLIALMVTLGAAYFFSNFHRLALAVVGSDVAAEFHLTAVQLGTLGSVVFYSYALMQIPCGILSDKYGARRMITISCILVGFSALLFSQAGSYELLLVSRTLTGIGISMVYVPALSAIRKQFGDLIFGSMTGILVAMGQLGAVSASAPLRFLCASFGWRATFSIIGLVCLGLCTLSWFFILPEPVHQADAPTERLSYRVFLKPAILALPLWFFCTGGARLSFQGLWGGQFFTKALNSSATDSSLYLMSISLGCVAGSIIFGRLSDHFGSLRTVIGSTVLFGMSWTGMLILTPSDSHTIIMILMSVMGATGAGGFTAGFACIREIKLGLPTGLATGFNNCALFLGSAVFTQATGSVLGLFGERSTLGQYQGLFIIFALLSLLCVLVLLVAFRPQLKRQQKPER